MQFLISGFRKKILDAHVLQIITEKSKSLEYLLLSFEIVEALDSSC